MSKATRMLHTVLVHGGLEALVEPAGATLVAVSLVDRAASLQVTGSFAGVHSVAMDTAFEEP